MAIGAALAIGASILSSKEGRGAVKNVLGGVGKLVGNFLGGKGKDQQQVASNEGGTIWDINGDGKVTPQEKMEVARLLNATA